MINGEMFYLYIMLKSKKHNYKQIENYILENSNKFDVIILKGYEKLISVKSNDSKNKHCKLLVQDMETLFRKKGVNMVKLHVLTQCKFDYWAIYENLCEIERTVSLLNIKSLLKLHNEFYLEVALEMFCELILTITTRQYYLNRMKKLMGKNEIKFFRNCKDKENFKRCEESTKFFIQNMNDLIDLKENKNKQH